LEQEIKLYPYSVYTYLNQQYCGVILISSYSKRKGIVYYVKGGDISGGISKQLYIALSDFDIFWDSKERMATSEELF
jgi:hypothetical protein